VKRLVQGGSVQLPVKGKKEQVMLEVCALLDNLLEEGLRSYANLVARFLSESGEIRRCGSMEWYGTNPPRHLVRHMLYHSQLFKRHI
jgi:hypothetical protein